MGLTVAIMRPTVNPGRILADILTDIVTYILTFTLTYISTHISTHWILEPKLEAETETLNWNLKVKLVTGKRNENQNQKLESGLRSPSCAAGETGGGSGCFDLPILFEEAEEETF